MLGLNVTLSAWSRYPRFLKINPLIVMLRRNVNCLVSTRYVRIASLRLIRFIALASFRCGNRDVETSDAYTTVLIELSYAIFAPAFISLNMRSYSWLLV